MRRGFDGHAGDGEGSVEGVQRYAWAAYRITLSHDEALVPVPRAELGPIRLRLLAQECKAKGEA